MRTKFKRLLLAVAPMVLLLAMANTAKAATGTAYLSVVGGTRTWSSCNEFWSVAPGATITIQLDNVTECSGTSINGLVQSSTAGNTPFVLGQIAPKTYQGQVTLPTGGCATAVVSYCGATGGNLISRQSINTAALALVPRGCTLGSGTGHLQFVDATGKAIQCCSWTCPPATATVECGPGATDPSNTGSPTNVTCSTARVEKSDTETGGTCPVVKVITRTWKLIVQGYVQKTCTQTITVKDTKAPTISVGTVKGCYANDAAAIADIKANSTATDTCAGDVTSSIGVTKNISSGCSVTFTVSATDGCNVATQDVTVKVLTTPPAFTGCPDPTGVQCYGDLVEPTAPKATDACGTDLTVTLVKREESNSGKSCNNVISYKWSATDCADQTSYCETTITVNDDTAPVPPAKPDDINVECAVPPAGQLTAHDNCKGDITVTGVDGSPVNDESGCGYTVRRTWTFVDDCGNSSSVYQDIHVKDTTAPVFSDCPTEEQTATGSKSVVGHENICGALVSFCRTATDNCGGTVTITYSVKNLLTGTVTDNVDCHNYFLTQGQYEVTAVAMDTCGNTSECKWTITVSNCTTCLLCDPDGKPCTLSQGGWGSPANSEPGKFLDAHFTEFYPSGVTIGGGFTIHFSSPAAIRAFLPATTTASQLTGNHTDPTATEAGVFAGQVLAVQLSVDFSEGVLGSYYLCGSPYTDANGLTVNQILADANNVLGGGLSAYGMSVSTLNALLTDIIAARDGCHDGEFAQYLSLTKCPDPTK